MLLRLLLLLQLPLHPGRLRALAVAGGRGILVRDGRKPGSSQCGYLVILVLAGTRMDEG